MAKFKNKEQIINLTIAVLATSAILISYWFCQSVLKLSSSQTLIILVIEYFILMLGLLFAQKPSLGVLVLIAVLPFERLPSLEIAGYTVKINQLIIAATGLAYLIFIIRNKSFKLRAPEIFWWLMLFLVSLMVSAVGAENLTRTALVFGFTLLAISGYFLIVQLIDNIKKLKLALNIIFGVIVVISLFGLYQYLGDKYGLSTSWTGLRLEYTHLVLSFPRIQATFIEPLFFANYLIFSLSITAVLFVSDQIKMKWYFLAIFFVILLTDFLLTSSRGAAIGLAASFLLILIFKLKSFWSIKKLIFIISVFAITSGSVLILLGPAAKQFFVHSQAPIKSTNEPSSQERLSNYQLARKAFLEHPIIGLGLGNFGTYYNQQTKTTAPTWRIDNNQYLEILAETGTIGFLAFAGLLVVIFIKSFQAYFISKDKWLKAVILGAICGFMGILVQFNFFSTLYIIYIWAFLGFLVAAQKIANLQKSS